jgi:hypothetical protein
MKYSESLLSCRWRSTNNCNTYLGGRTDLLKILSQFLHRNIILPFDVSDYNNDCKTKFDFHLSALHALSRK